MRAILLLLACSAVYAQVPGPNGLGQSTLTCLDRDGDDYGTGPTVVINTTTNSPITVTGSQVVTPVDMTGIAVGTRLRIIDTGATSSTQNPSQEYVLVTAITASTFTATFANTHSALPGDAIQITDQNCLGPDADDLDPTIHTGPQAITQWGTLSALINHLEGFTPTHIWYLAPATATSGCLNNGGTTGQCTGNDSNSCEDNINAPCLTGAHIQGSVTAGMAVVFRNGWNGRYSSGSGSAGNPIILMAYPGELPVIDQSALAGSQLILNGQSYLIVDGFRTQHGSCLSGGDNNYAENPHTFHDNVFKHIEGTDCAQGFGPTAGIQNDTLQDSVFHDNNGVGEQSGVYWGGTCVPSSGATIQRVISYHNNFSGIHLNSVANGITVTQNLVYNNSIEGIALESGINTSTVTDNLAFGDNGAEFEIYSYQNALGPVAGCDASLYNVTNATWSSASGGQATLTLSGTNTITAGQYEYITGITPSGYNCTNNSVFGTGTGCKVLSATSSSITYALPSNPGSYVSGGTIGGGVGDQANNLIENNTLWHNNLDYQGLAVGNQSAIWVSSHCVSGATSCTPGNPVNGDLGHNTFRNNIAVNYGDTNSSFRYAPIAFDNTNGPTFLGTSIFDHTFTWQSNGVDSTTAAYGIFETCIPTCSGEAVYDFSGGILNGGPALSSVAPGYTILAGGDGNPSFVSASSTYNTTPSLYNFDLQPGSAALHTGQAISVPAYDLYGGPFIGQPSRGAITGAAWRDLSSTHLQSVCPPNNYNGIAYNFSDNCKAVINAWSTAAYDTKRAHMIIWGGGHVDYSGNEVYSLNLGLAPPTLTRITNPSDFTQNPAGCPDTNIVDGTPVSRHTYGGLAYLPVQDKMFSFGGALAPCGGPISLKTYTLDLSHTPPVWAAMDPINGYNLPAGTYSHTAVCGYDPNTTSMICNQDGYFFSYNPATNTNTFLNSGQFIPYFSYGVVDPKRKLFYFFGVEYMSTVPHLKVLDISNGSSYILQDWSNLITGCNAIAGILYPGLTYDSQLDRVVGWPNAGNTIYLFNPDAKTCTAETFPNGPPVSTELSAGTFGRIAYDPNLNTYAVESGAGIDAFSLTLSINAKPIWGAIPGNITFTGRAVH